ncbi:MAG: deoxyribodipyrimidine photo-lyase [Fimbriimonas sp.]
MSLRSRTLNDKPVKDGLVVYYVQRDQRIHDNWALLTAQEMAGTRGQRMAVVFSLSPTFVGGTWRQYAFMLAGLREMEAGLREKGIPFFLLSGSPGETLPRFAEEHAVGVVVCDFNPIRPVTDWNETWARRLEVALVQIDAHNVVPAWVASDKQEMGAYTLRRKLQMRHWEFLTDFPEVESQGWDGEWPVNDWEAAEASLRCDRSVGPVDWIVPGEAAARKALRSFVKEGLVGYSERRKFPDQPLEQSQLSPYFHFGQLAPQRAALMVRDAEAPAADRDAFLDELLIRRELSDNFCLYADDYRSLASVPAWAVQTLDDHRDDPRSHLYTREELEAASTHDDLWNAAQLEMIRRGKMHNYMRMYWAKKILEWSPTPEEALATTVFLNDKYFLDGRDANGYANILWSIAGLHDRPWMERPVYGKVRYMNRNGAERKFDVQAYIRWVSSLGEAAQASTPANESRSEIGKPIQQALFEL